MYFREKEETNIDSEFETNNKKSFEFKDLLKKPIFIIISGVVILTLIILIIVISISNNNKYTIELQGEETVVIIQGNDYIEAGYKAYDKKKNDHTNKVTIVNNVDTSKVGEYEIMYSIDKINKVRYVKVIEKIDETYIYLEGEIHTYLEVGEKYVEPGFNAEDTIDGNVKNKVKITNDVNSSKVGVYKVVYSVTNSRNKKTTKTRYVHVVEKGQKPKK